MPFLRVREDFQWFLASKGGSKRHPEVTRSRAKKTLELANVKRVSELSLSQAQHAIQLLRDEGLSIETVNHHIRAVNAALSEAVRLLSEANQ